MWIIPKSEFGEESKIQRRNFLKTRYIINIKAIWKGLHFAFQRRQKEECMRCN